MVITTRDGRKLPVKEFTFHKTYDTDNDVKPTAGFNRNLLQNKVEEIRKRTGISALTTEPDLVGTDGELLKETLFISDDVVCYLPEYIFSIIVQHDSKPLFAARVWAGNLTEHMSINEILQERGAIHFFEQEFK